MDLLRDDQELIDLCYTKAVEGGKQGIPIGSVLARDGKVVSVGYNRRVQDGDPTAHGEMNCLKNAGRLRSYRDMTLYTSLSPCMMCSGTIVQFKIGKLVILENKNFGGNEKFLQDNGVELEIVDDVRAVKLMADFIRNRPDLWYEDIAE